MKVQYVLKCTRQGYPTRYIGPFDNTEIAYQMGTTLANPLYAFSIKCVEAPQIGQIMYPAGNFEDGWVQPK